jgi:hypothetical protein
MNAKKMLVDCRKVRETLEIWRNKPEKPKWMLLGLKDNQRHRVWGKKGSDLVDFRPIDREIMINLTNALDVPDDYFEASEADYQSWKSRRRSELVRSVGAQHSPHANETTKDTALPGVDHWITKALAPSDRVENLHSQLEGFYEVYHHATSKRKKKEISIFLLEVRGIDRDHNTIRCEVYDQRLDRPYFHFRGHILELNGFLYWELRTKQDDAICYCCSYIPSGDNYPGHTVFGIFLTTSGDNKRDYPVAAKAAIRFIGETPDQAVQNCVVDLRDTVGDAESLLKNRIGGYLSDFKKERSIRPEILELITNDIIPEITNEIRANASPMALIMPRESRNPRRLTKRPAKVRSAFSR